MFQLTDTGPKIKKKINSQLAVKELSHSGVFFVDFKQNSCNVQVFQLLNLKLPVLLEFAIQINLKHNTIAN